MRRLRPTVGILLVQIGMLTIPAAAQPQLPDSQVVLVGSPTLVVDPTSSSASTWIRIHNSTGEPASIYLSADDFISKTTKRALNAAITFSRTADTPGTPTVRDTLAAGETLVLRVAATGVWEAGESEARLLNEGKEIGKLRALKYRVPFSVKLVDSEGAVPELLFRRNAAHWLILRNEDAMTYPTTWELALQGEGAPRSGMITLSPNSSARFSVTAPNEWFSWLSGSVKDVEKKGVLTLRFTPPGITDDPSLPSKTIPVTVKLAYISESGQRIVSAILIFILLAAGGICSLFLSFGVPNKLRRIALRDRLEALATKLRTLSPRIESSLRVQLRVERKHLEDSLRRPFFFSPELPNVLKLAKGKAATLEKRAALLSAIDSTRDRLEKIRGGAYYVPPTILDEASKDLRSAAAMLGEPALEDDSLQEARGLIDAAQQNLDSSAEENEQLAIRVAKKIASLLDDFDQNGPVGRSLKCQELRTKLADLFEVLKDDQFTKPANIKPGEYYWIDSSAEKLFVLRHYILRFEDTRGEPWHQKVIASEEDLISLLKQKGALALDRARLLKKQIDTGVFADDVRQSLEKGEVEIETLPPRPRVNEPTVLSAVLRPDYNHSAAKNEFQCVWHFGDLGEERGWQITHFFAQSGERPPALQRMRRRLLFPFRGRRGDDANDGYKVRLKVSFEDANGKPLTKPSQPSEKLEKEKTITIDKSASAGWGDRTKIEMIRFLVALFAVLLALMAGAREQLLELDFAAAVAAIFLLGFGADTVKNLLTQGPQSD